MNGAQEIIVSEYELYLVYKVEVGTIAAPKDLAS